ncbi:right-handed parallel beta-helix repeat-containing protein [Chitinophaga nivalis]|uniref:Right-handed parallel beta-helix repeat-containing protein n=1 Tax=Chitinophaga nivalis TaxID=2991709 RepID=A0ABT3IRH5_9BACT|nr:right-handed parallel beta-helix repeat-containing protein [Chitinophaga nivalis]MCW3463955.1 right-handed parallel beta-helix repeat-containing protein [Chitinophaga nivalis]MCW3486355.1 right-handed parallel beta-helix repeat-containing protein [Chitinophaga nivalis]
MKTRTLFNHQSWAVFIAVVLFYSFTNTSCRKNMLEQEGLQTEQLNKDNLLLNGREFTLVPDANGRLLIDNANNYYQPGDILNLVGNFSGVYFYNFSGTAANPILIRNGAGAPTVIGNPAWNGGSWAEGLVFMNCHHIKLGGRNSKSDFVINGSTQPARDAYFDLILRNHTDNFEISNLTINNGGTGILAKTEPVLSDSASWYPNSYMQNLRIHDVTISGTQNESMYIGHTATYWNLSNNTPKYDTAFTPGQFYVQPIKWNNVRIYNNYVTGSGADGIQTAAIDQLEVYNNEVTNWALQHNYGHNGGILIGGRTTNTNTHDNYVHDGWGEMCQFYGSGEFGTHIIHNNLFRDNQAENSGISMRGTQNAIVQITHNTISKSGGALLRINGYTGQNGPQIVNANAFIQPRTAGGVIYPSAYIYTENGGAVTEGTGANVNTRFLTVAAANVDVNNYYLPNAGSPMGASGYRKTP